MAQAEGDKALRKFTTITDRVSQFEARINTNADTNPSIHTSRVRLEQIRALWDKVEKEYETCSEVVASQTCKDKITAMQSKYDDCYTVYERCAASLNEIIADSHAQQSVQSSNLTPSQGGCRLPPVECEVFNGDYVQWPTFRDLFSAIYIRNPRLSEVEKLFHLNAKTSGEAKCIVALSPLTNDGFESAWINLQNRFENKRMLVNSLLKILFNLPSVAQECGKSLKHLESTIQGCLTALQLARVETTNWNCLLVFLCSSKLPKLTLALWEQSLLSKSEIPLWAEFQAFLKDRHRTLEAIEEFKPNASVQSRALRADNSSRSIQTFENRVTVNPQSCSEATFISERLFNLIKLPYESIQAQVSGVNLSVAAQPRKRCQLNIGSPVKPHIQIETCAYVLPQLAGNLPSYTIPEDSLKGLPPLQLADPDFYRSSPIDVLIGADILPSIILRGSHSNISRLAVTESKPDSILTKFGEVEDVPVKLVKESTSVCEENFIRSTKRNSTTTKVRVVFNASNPSSNGNSLDDILHAGPGGHHQDVPANSGSHLRRKLCAFLAIKVLQQLAQDIRGQYPLASDIISNSTYIDDVLAVAHTQQSAITAYSKREVVSQIAKLFDPGWDQPLPTDLVTQWQEFVKGYPILREIRSPTWVRFHPAAKLQYQDAYGAAIFIRVETTDGGCTHRLTSKARVPLVRSISIPRLERFSTFDSHNTGRHPTTSCENYSPPNGRPIDHSDSSID
ncbi:uncharacterized protein [Drosophila kikkawai]|uniref:Uncharacterized protein n=1 Tax=Drosophila kikkawai TaxID=30033 RepID=A0ABM4GQN3_DROKI